MNVGGKIKEEVKAESPVSNFRVFGIYRFLWEFYETCSPLLPKKEDKYAHKEFHKQYKKVYIFLSVGTVGSVIWMNGAV